MSAIELPEIGIRLDPATPEAKAAIGFEYAGLDVGKRSKFGGKPDWIQGDDTPKCSCGENMTFYGQLDSIGDSVCLADCGMIYIFVCFGCYHTKSVLQT